MFRIPFLAVLVTVGFATVGPGARAGDRPIVLTPQDIRWQAAPADFPKGVEIAYVYGNVAQPGPFVIRVKMPAHAQIAPHTHNMDETLTVLAGHFTHYIGKSFTGAQANELATGGFVQYCSLRGYNDDIGAIGWRPATMATRITWFEPLDAAVTR
ncbi:cupin domain-containing protein, partial [Gluconacetobacter sp. 1b LMG 1731]